LHFLTTFNLFHGYFMTATTESISTEAKLNWTNVAFFSAFHLAALAAPFYFSWQAVILTVFLHWLFGHWYLPCLSSDA